MGFIQVHERRAANGEGRILVNTEAVTGVYERDGDSPDDKKSVAIRLVDGHEFEIKEGYDWVKTALSPDDE